MRTRTRTHVSRAILAALTLLALAVPAAAGVEA